MKTLITCLSLLLASFAMANGRARSAEQGPTESAPALHAPAASEEEASTAVPARNLLDSLSEDLAAQECSSAATLTAY